VPIRPGRVGVDQAMETLLLALSGTAIGNRALPRPCPPATRPSTNAPTTPARVAHDPASAPRPRPASCPGVYLLTLLSGRSPARLRKSAWFLPADARPRRDYTRRLAVSTPWPRSPNASRTLHRIRRAQPCPTVASAHAPQPIRPARHVPPIGSRSAAPSTRQALNMFSPAEIADPTADRSALALASGPANTPPRDLAACSALRGHRAGAGAAMRTPIAGARHAPASPGRIVPGTDPRLAVCCCWPTRHYSPAYNRHSTYSFG